MTGRGAAAQGARAHLVRAVEAEERVDAEERVADGRAAVDVVLGRDESTFCTSATSARSTVVASARRDISVSMGGDTGRRTGADELALVRERADHRGRGAGGGEERGLDGRAAVLEERAEADVDGVVREEHTQRLERGARRPRQAARRRRRARRAPLRDP
jgi:hypothetical protein